MKKVFVAVSAEFTTDGQVMPRSFAWEDGMCYEIDRILDIRPGSSLKVGGIGLRYTCIISGKQHICIFTNQNGLWSENDIQTYIG